MSKRKRRAVRVFGSVAKAGTNIEGLIRKNLDAVGGTSDTALTAFTDGCPGLRGILADAGVLEPPILDWFHIAMRVQHLKQISDGLAAGDPARLTAKAVIVTEVERLRWRIWNGKAKNARKSIDRIRAVMHHFRGERDSRKSIARSRKLWTALRAYWTKYLTGQSARGWSTMCRNGTEPGWRVQRHRDHRRNSHFPGGPPDEQKSANALVTARRPPSASGSVRGL